VTRDLDQSVRGSEQSFRRKVEDAVPTTELRPRQNQLRDHITERGLVKNIEV
jgi:hypothetical protein